MEKTLDVNPCTLSRALPFLAQITRPKADTCAGLATVQDICARAQIFMATCEGRDVAAFAVEPYEYDRGTCLFLVGGAGSLEGVDLTATMAKVLEVQARQIGAKQIGLMTKRPAMIKKMKAQGFEVVGVKLVKKL